MSFNSNEGRQSFTASSGQTAFAFNFKIYVVSDVKVYLTPVGQAPDDVADLLSYSSEYTVTIDGDNGGTITLLSSATFNDTLVLERQLPRTRDISYVTNGDLKAATLNEDQDYQTYLLVDDFNIADRSLSLPSTDVTMSPELPTTQTGQYLRVKDDGTGFEYVDLDTEVSESKAAAAASAASALESAGYATNSAASAVTAGEKAQDSADSAIESQGYANAASISATQAYQFAQGSFLTDESAYDLGFVADTFNLFPTDLGGLA